ncbi:hypothetical protein DLD77_07860 [Chitinophaga alhagiae]|uniref:DUF4843 domain-containing protein n=2 Tax=Chitinophaga alhagiae TaxID=2203219 RepID=A0ABN5LV09_9BACT|nr:hypothetical protein DLD77_07860 [Chitinophaga alhagiae]
MKFYQLFAGVMVVVLLAACKKEKSQEEPVVQNTCDYAPYTTGSSFAYQQVAVSSPDTFYYTLQVMGDSVVNGEQFRVLEDDAGSGMSLFRCGGGSYVQLADIAAVSNVPSNVVKTEYLKENVALGGGWQEQFPINLPIVGDVQLTVDYTIMQKGTSKTVLGTVFNNVIGVRMEVSVPPYLPPTELSTNYYAKGVGLIQLDTDTDTTRLQSYAIR